MYDVMYQLYLSEVALPTDHSLIGNRWSPHNVTSTLLNFEVTQRLLNPDSGYTR